MNFAIPNATQITKQFKKIIAILIFMKNRSSSGTTIHHMIPNSIKFYTRWSWHELGLINLLSHVQSRPHFPGHLTGQCGLQEMFSNFFKVVHSCFAKTLNKRIKRKGQVVMDRFQSPTMESDEDLKSVMIYNDLNPFRTIKGTHPRKYKWSSYHHYARGKKDPLLTEPECYKEMGKTPEDRQRNYRYMIDEITKNDHRTPKCPYRGEKGPLCFIGNPHWVKERYDQLKGEVRKLKKEWQDRHKEFLGIYKAARSQTIANYQFKHF